jgi:ABC-2 type transport system ATP-binding protein
MSIEVSRLAKSYGTQRAVDDVSFQVGKGEIVGFLGPNGAGKSTTLKMITGYLQPDAGSVRVCGIDVKTDSIAARQRMGYLPEHNPLYPDMYIREYLDFMASVHRLPDRKKSVHEAMVITGLMPEAGKRIGQLSKGYRQRVGFAAALIHQPEVLILDEPTTGFDPNQITEIREVIRRLGQDKTVLFSSHILQEVEALCDRVIIIHQGHIVADDRLEILQKTSGQGLIRVTFASAPDPALMNEVPAARVSGSADGLQWSIETDDPEAVRRRLLELSLSHTLNIVSLHTEAGSLEEVFRKLTRTN